MEKGLFHAINQGPHNEVLDSVVVFVSDYRFWLFLAILILFIDKDKNKIFSIFALGIASIIISSISVSLLKIYFAKPRPCTVLNDIRLLVDCPSSFSMPSGHASTAFTAATLMRYFARQSAIPAFILAVFVALSRIYVGVHYPGDVLAGALWGSAVAGVMLFLQKKYYRDHSGSA